MNAPALLHERLRPLFERESRVHRHRVLTALWIGLAIIAILLLLGKPTLAWFLILLLAGIIGFLAVSAITRRFNLSKRDLAKRVERDHPDLQALLTTAVEQEGDELNLLQQRVVIQAADEILARDLETEHARKTAHRAATGLWGAFLAFVIAALLLFLRVWPASIGAPPEGPRIATNAPTPEPPATTIEVNPGSIEIERGSRVPVSARFAGTIPAEATLVYRSATEQDAPTNIPMARNLDDPLFGAVIESVDSDTSYHVDWENGQSETFTLTTYELPRLLQADAIITPPADSSLEPQTLPDTKRVTLFQGSELQFTFRLNKEVAIATLVPKPEKPNRKNPKKKPLPPAEAIELTQHGTNNTLLIHTWIPQHSATYRLELTDIDSRKNRKPPVFSIKVRPNLPPKIELVFPKRDLEVTPIQEVETTAHVWDDGGLSAVGAAITFNGRTTDVPLDATAIKADKKQTLATLLDFETLGAKPNQLLTYFFWAEDTGPDGQPRRVESDMFFTEVRHFEEIYQKMPQMSSMSEQQQQEMQEQMKDIESLLKNQKEIINGTWKVKRRDSNDPRNKDDLQLLADSQTQIIETASEALAEITDPQMALAMRHAITDMETAVEHLGEPEPQQALAAEQAAYDHLLDLRSRLFKVMQQQQPKSQSQQQQNQRRQQQLMQMDMKENEDRYETQRFAQEQQSEQAQQEQQEDLEMLNRLRELAQRQEDTAEKIKELEAALAAAETEAEKEELLRELKRLTDEQRELLADLDELNEQMNEEQNQERTSEAREQLTQTREQAQKASQKLTEGELSQAANSATRAKEDLEQLAEDFREQTSARFAEDMRDLRREVRELSEKQTDIAGQLEEQREVSQGTVADSLNNQELSRDLAKQEERLDNLLERLGEISEDAAESETLLSGKAYDAVRETETAGTREALEEASKLSSWNQLTRAAEREKKAREQIETLVRDVEAAAESVLGDETEALRMASRQVQQLVEDAQREVQEATGQGEATSGRTDPSDQTDQTGGQEPSEQQGQQPGQGQQPRKGQQGKGQTGNQQTSQNPNSQSRVPNPAAHTSQPGSRPQSFFDAWNQDATRKPNGSPAGGPNESPAPFSNEENDDFRDWSDRLRSVEEALDTPTLRREAAAIRNRARELRRESKRHSKDPNWDLVGENVLEPLRLLQQQINEELARLEPDQHLVPLDRDPVPKAYEDLVRKYYETLGAGQ